jgi:uncharacterized protein YecE (DUF72 family)
VLVRTGTSGFSYDEWHGRFYPDDLAASERLGFYGSRLKSVEINNTFYQMPKEELLVRWRDAVPADFCFALKAPRRITHVLRLKGAEDPLRRFIEVAGVLGGRLGPLLFQLPPFARKDTGLLAEFLSLLPPGQKAAFEFRHPSWFDEETYAVLASKDASLCTGDADDEGKSPPFVATASFGYLRLRSPSYDAKGLGTWCERILAQKWTEAFAYLKHEVDGPAYAGFLDAVAGGKPLPELPVAAPSAEPPAAKAKKARRVAKVTPPEPASSPRRSKRQ